MDQDQTEKDELRRAAETSGKPLEVEVAAILQEVWRKGHPPLRATISLGSYFIDQASDKYRELDVLVEHSERLVVAQKEVDLATYVLCSCKGFPEGVQPITYSMPKDAGPDFSAPSFMCSRESLLSEDAEFGARLAGEFLTTGYLGQTRRIIGFDTIASERNSQKNQAAPKLARKGDRELFLDGWDSAVKASLYWTDLPSPKPYYARVLVPLLVLPEPWWDFPIEGGKVGDPARCSLCYTTTLYPTLGAKRAPQLLTTLVVSLDKLPDLAATLKFLVCHFEQNADRLAKAVIK